MRDALRAQVRGGQLKSFQSLILMAREIEADRHTGKGSSGETQRATVSSATPQGGSVFPNPIKRYFKASRVAAKAAAMVNLGILEAGKRKVVRLRP